MRDFCDEDKKSFRRTEDLMYASTEVVENKFTGNTTIGIILTNGEFSKASLCKIAGMAHDGVCALHKTGSYNC